MREERALHFVDHPVARRGGVVCESVAHDPPLPAPLSTLLLPHQMGVVMLLGCILIAYSVPTVVFFLMMVRKAQLVIVMLARSELRCSARCE